jgi:hypothetical protein
MDYFEGKLTKEDFGRLENLYGLYNELSFMAEEESYIYGFKLGALLSAEVSMGRDKIVHE